MGERDDGVDPETDGEALRELCLAGAQVAHEAHQITRPGDDGQAGGERSGLGGVERRDDALRREGFGHRSRG